MGLDRQHRDTDVQSGQKVSCSEEDQDGREISATTATRINEGKCINGLVRVRSQPLPHP